MSVEDCEKLKKELTQYQCMLARKDDDIKVLNTTLNEIREEQSRHETENISLKRLVERVNAENDQLLQQLDSLGKSVQFYEDNEKSLKEELAMLKEHLTESSMARDNVIENLKDVSIETRELIDDCNKAYEENEFFKIKAEELEREILALRQQNESLNLKNHDLHIELETRNLEIKSLERKLESFNSQSPLPDNCVWQNEIVSVNSELQNIEQQIKTIIVNLKNNFLAKQTLEKEIENMRSENTVLREQNVCKDELISKQSNDFLEMKATVDEYYTEILRLGGEFKDCRKRVATVNENLESMLTFENVDIAEFACFKRSLSQFGSWENVESLLSKLEVLQEIEQFFEKKLSPKVEQTDKTDSPNESVETSKKQGTINKIKSYLEQALSAIEKLNDKIIRMRTEYENKLRTKSAEISTLREVLSNATLYNTILEQTLQQYKDNFQLDKSINNETDELLIVNETLLDGFHTLKQLYRISEQSISFLFAKSEQLKFFIKLLELYVRKIIDQYDGTHSETQKQRIFELLSLIRDVFEEIDVSEPSAQKLIECQEIVERCEKSLVTKDYLKNTVENMSQEVKRLTSKVEFEMAQKIREIEELKGEVDNVKTDNRELVYKIKNCNREIVSLSTENYDLNEKLENLTKLEKRCDVLKQELEKVKKRLHDNRSPSENNIDSVDVADKIKNLKEVCSVLKTENANVKCAVSAYFKENQCILSEAQKMFAVYAADSAVRDENLVTFQQQCSDTTDDQTNNKQLIIQADLQVKDDSTVEADNQTSTCQDSELKSRLILLKNTCVELRRENDALKSNVAVILKSAVENILPELHSTFNQLTERLDSCEKNESDYRSRICSTIDRISDVSNKMKNWNDAVRLVNEEMRSECGKEMQSVIGEIQKAVINTFENIKSSFTISNEEMIREMQEMNTELKKRGENISKLSQTIAEIEKEKSNLAEQMSEKEETIKELTSKMENQMKEFEDKELHASNMETELGNVKLQYSTELKQKEERVENLSTELENLNSQIRSKDDTIAALKSEIQKQKEIHDGDVSSVGTISRSEEASRLKDVEDTFEEKYMKLKIIALKMKKNIADLSQELKTEKMERTTLQNKLAAVAKQAKMSQALQEECDKLNDELELKMNEIKELKKIIQTSDKGGENMKTQIDDLKKKIEIAEMDLTTSKNENSQLESKLKATTSQLEATNKQKLTEEILKKEKDKEVQQLKQKLKEIEDAKVKIQNELEQAKTEVRKQGALTLEMRDFEKTISDLRADVSNKEVKIMNLVAKLNSSTDENATFIEKIKQLEEQLSSYIDNNKIADKQILSLNKTISDCERNLKEKEAQLKQANVELENEKSKNESLLSQLTNSTAEIESMKDSFHSKETSLTAQVKSLQSKLLSLQDTLQKNKSEYSQLEEDYNSYKMRAHKLLEKIKNENNVKSNEEKLQMEIDTLGQTVKILKKQLDSTLAETNNQKEQFELIQASKEKLQNRVTKLSISLSEKSEELDAARAEHRAYKLNTDTLVNCYKAEIENLKTENENIRSELQSALAKTKETETKLMETNDHFTKRPKTPNEWCENGAVSNLSSGSPDLELENIDEAKTMNKRKHSLIPLDKLLDSKGGNDEGPFNKIEMELRTNIQSLEEQVKYFTRILNESEKNSARNEQQVSLLKEEIRRLQRIVEREPHLQNTEYLKNILIKFITLPLGDEKSQLVTVFDTILKLTPDEKQALTSAAKGLKLDQKPPVGWTSYLGW